MVRKRVSNELRAMAVGMTMAGASISAASRHLGISRKCVRNTVERLESTGTVSDRRHSGRKPTTTERTVRAICNEVRHDRCSTAREVCTSLQLPIGERRVQQILKKRLWKKGSGGRKPRLRPFDKQRRLNWCRQHVSWTSANWQRILFSDESRFELYNRKARRRVWKSPTRRCLDETVTPTLQGGAGAVGIWGCMSADGTGCSQFYRGTLTSANYVDVLRNTALPSRDLLFPQQQLMIFQQDNAPIHTARIVSEFLNENDIPVLPWAPYSPDLNPIEFLWNVIDQKLRRIAISSLDDLSQHIHEAWLAITPDTCRKLVLSMPERCRRCIRARGGYFKEVRLREI